MNISDNVNTVNSSSTNVLGYTRSIIYIDHTRSVTFQWNRGIANLVRWSRASLADIYCADLPLGKRLWRLQKVLLCK